MNKQNHKRWRKAFRESVFARDNHRCCMCECINDIESHHITNPKSIINHGYVLSNGITLCGGDNPESCHYKAEKYHITNGKQWEEGFHPDDLYKLIGSSLEQAIEDSKNLK